MKFFELKSEIQKELEQYIRDRSGLFAHTFRNGDLTEAQVLIAQTLYHRINVITDSASALVELGKEISQARSKLTSKRVEFGKPNNESDLAELLLNAAVNVTVAKVELGQAPRP